MASNTGSTAAIIAATTAINAVAAQQRAALLKHFREQQALSPAQAIASGGFDPALKRVADWYQAQGVLKRHGDGQLYLDERALRELEEKQKRSALIALFVVLGMVVVTALTIAVVFAVRG